MKKLKKIMTGAMTAAVVTLAGMVPAYAGPFGSSKFATGTQNLINDISTWLAIIGPIAGAMCAGYFFIRRSAADEVDGKQWSKRIVIAIVCGVGTLLVGGIIALLTSYYV